MSETCCPRLIRVPSEIRQPWALTVVVRPASSNFCVPLVPRTKIGIAMCTRCVRRISGYVDRPLGTDNGSFIFDIDPLDARRSFHSTTSAGQSTHPYSINRRALGKL